jgi:hypothetical protein
MAIINVYLGKICNNTGLSSTEEQTVQSTLQGFFTTICTGTSHTANVQWVTSAPSTVSATDLICYFVPSRSESAVIHAPGNSTTGSGHGFTFRSATGSCSEVYTSLCRGSGGANWFTELAFHELMHNKLNLGDATLHSRDGLAHLPVTGGATPSAANITQMRAALGTSRTQWFGGWAAITCPDPNDPLAGL